MKQNVFLRLDPESGRAIVDESQQAGNQQRSDLLSVSVGRKELASYRVTARRRA